MKEIYESIKGGGGRSPPGKNGIWGEKVKDRGEVVQVCGKTAGPFLFLESWSPWLCFRQVGKWNPSWMCGKDIKGSTIGFVGFGRIAQATAKLLSSFGVQRFLYNTRKEVPVGNWTSFRPSCERVDLDFLLSSSDFVIVLCSSNETSKHLVGSKFLSKMKSDAILINASRGDVLDQTALQEALEGGTIRGAGLDVTSPEPLPQNHPLLHLPNCTVLPHIGSATVSTRNAMALLAAENLIACLNGQPMPSEVL